MTIETLRKRVARDLSGDYEQNLEFLRKYNVFGNWTDEELCARPVNLEELEYIKGEVE